MPDGHVNQMLNVDLCDWSSAMTKHWRILETIYLQIIKERIKKKNWGKVFDAEDVGHCHVHEFLSGIL